MKYKDKEQMDNMVSRRYYFQSILDFKKIKTKTLIMKSILQFIDCILIINLIIKT